MQWAILLVCAQADVQLNNLNAGLIIHRKHIEHLKEWQEMKPHSSEIGLMKRSHAAVRRTPLPPPQVPPMATNPSQDVRLLTAALQGASSEPKGYWLSAHCE